MQRVLRKLLPERLVSHVKCYRGRTKDGTWVGMKGQLDRQPFAKRIEGIKTETDGHWVELLTYVAREGGAEA